MKAAAVFATLVVLFTVIMAHAQAPPSRNAAMKATTGDKTAAVHAHLSVTQSSVTQSLDRFVKHLQNEGYQVNQVKRDLNTDGTLKNYSFQWTNGGKKTPDAEHMSVEINMNPARTATGKQGLPPVLGRTPAALPVSASQFTQLLKGLSAESFDEGKIFYIIRTFA